MAGAIEREETSWWHRSISIASKPGRYDKVLLSPFVLSFGLIIN